MNRKIASIGLMVLILFSLSACGSASYNEKALHINYTSEENYGNRIR